MNNDEIVDELKHENIVSDVEVQSKKLDKFVIFLIDDKEYCFPQEIVQEIIIDSEVYYLPFVPGYIRGLINRQGEPYTVVDLKILMGDQALNANKFIIIRSKTDKLSFIITDILKIIPVEKDNINVIQDQNDADNYFLNIITMDDKKIPVIDYHKIVKRIKNDI